MFERYTEKARRVIFFARYEASQFGSPWIETEHLLLGLLREDREILKRVTPSSVSPETIRQEIEAQTPVREKVSTSVDLPLSEACKRVLTYAAEEAERLAHKHIGTWHLLLGLLREEACLGAKILQGCGLRLEKLRAEAGGRENPPTPPARVESLWSLAAVTRDLTAAAAQNELDHLVGREGHLEQVIRVLCRRDRKNPLLVGEPEVGKTAIVHGLAQRIASGSVPPPLENKRLLALDFAPLVAVVRDSKQLEDRVFPILKELAEAANLIIFLDDLFAKSGALGGLDAAKLLKPLLTQKGVQCIAAAIPGDYRQAVQEEPWVKTVFNVVGVPSPDDAETLEILAGVKKQFEQFHNVHYTVEALQYAVRHSQRYLPDRRLPGKAIDLIDEAGAYVATRAARGPDEVFEAQRRVTRIVRQFENAIANHEFQKARSYSDEERVAREELRQLRAKHNLEEMNKVTLDDIEYVVSQWTRLPLETIRQERLGSAPPGDDRPSPASG
jgi:ATP-dependent Clp protease ATP-binding subunit ClpC